MTNALAVVVIAVCGQALGAVHLTGMQIMGLNANWRYDGTGWETVGANFPWNLQADYNGHPLTRTGDWPGLTLDREFGIGEHLITINACAAHSADQNYALNLFFDYNSVNPGISAISSVNPDAATIHGFQAFGGMAQTLAFTSAIPAANSLSWITADGTERIELTRLEFFTAEAFNVDEVSAYDRGPDGLLDQTGVIGFRITAIPAPGMFGLLPLIAIIRRSR
jgi:hypothetical protein